MKIFNTRFGFITFGKWHFGFRWRNNGPYFYPFNYLRNKELRYWGYESNWYDGPIHSFGFWFFNASWGGW